MRLLLCVALASAACGSSPAPATTAHPPTTTAPVSPGSTGGLSEAEFKAMHAPPTAGPAVREGETIDLAGTRAYLSLPKGKQGPFPAIVVIHEWWGLNANVEHWADRLARAGWAAIAVDLYGSVATTSDEAMALVKSVNEPKAAATIKAALDFAARDPRITATKQAVIGWCFGGGWSLRAAIANPELDGAIIYYGQPETDPAKLAPIKARILGVFGTRDKGIPPAKVDAFEAALQTAGVRAEILRYDADHAFANPSNPVYDEVSAGAAWEKVLAFLASL
jgi:carboxymethylenebutenolidase